jgi:HEAT repeat protein
MGTIAVGPLIGLLAGDERDQAVATGLLIAIGRPSVQPLIEALQNRDGAGEAVQIRAATTLGQINHPRAVAALATVANNGGEMFDGDYPVDLRVAAVHSLAASGHPFAKSALRRATTVRSRKVKKAAKEALG